MRVEILRGKKPSETGEAVLQAMEKAIRAAGDELTCTTDYRGGAEVLVLYGVGAAVHDAARRQQIAAGGRALLLDLGYFGRQKLTGYVRLSIDHDHPHRLLEKTSLAQNRWEKFAIELRADYKPDGPVVLVGLGRKSRDYLNLPSWEANKLAELKRRFPGREVIFRPKGRDYLNLPCRVDTQERIEPVLSGASLVICRHSNVAVDAVIAGVPFECEDGAAMWLQGKDFTLANRLDFLRRLAHWQYKPTEAAEAWSFAKRMMQ